MFKEKHMALIYEREFVDHYLERHEVRKMIMKRFHDKGIEIPFYQRTAHLKEEKGWQK